MFTDCSFHWKIFYKYNFSQFSIFGSTKKNWLRENYLGSIENPNKNKSYFYRFFFKKKKSKIISLSCVASPINIIFVRNRRKHNFLVSSLSHGKLSHFRSFLCFFSPHTLSVINSSLSSSHRSLSLIVYLLSFLHVSLPLCNIIL